MKNNLYINIKYITIINITWKMLEKNLKTGCSYYFNDTSNIWQSQAREIY